MEKLIVLRNRSEAMIFQTQDMLEEHKDKIPKDLNKKIVKAIKNLEKLMKDSEDPKEL